MWPRIVLMPWWARALAAAGGYALVVALSWCEHGLAGDPQQSWSFTLTSHVANVVIFGLVVAAFTSAAHSAYAYALAGLDSAHRSAAINASFRGPVPVDASVRDAAIRIAWRRLQSARSWRVLLGLLVLFEGLALALGKWPSGWDLEDWIDFAAFLVIAVGAWFLSQSLKHRIQMLRQAAST